MSVVPTNAKPGRVWPEHFLDDSGAGCLAYLLGLHDDAVSHLSLHRVLLHALFDSFRLSLDLDLY